MKILKKYFNFEHALMGFLVNGLSIFVLNLFSGTFLNSFYAGLTQGILTFTLFGFNVALFEYFIKNKHLFLSILIPTFISGFFSFLLHTHRGSSMPLTSASLMLVFALWNYVLYAWIYKKNESLSLKKIYSLGISYFKNK